MGKSDKAAIIGPVSAVGTRNLRLMSCALALCTLELLVWIGLLGLALAELDYSGDRRVLAQWCSLAGAVSALFVVWTLLATTWKRRRAEARAAARQHHTARKDVQASNNNKPFRAWKIGRQYRLPHKFH